MPEAGETREFVLSLRAGRGGTPRGTLRAAGDPHGTAFDGWIGLIGLITELGLACGEPPDDGDGPPGHPDPAGPHR